VAAEERKEQGRKSRQGQRWDQLPAANILATRLLIILTSVQNVIEQVSPVLAVLLLLQLRRWRCLILTSASPIAAALPIMTVVAVRHGQRIHKGDYRGP